MKIVIVGTLDAKGAQIKVITYSGRDSNTMPPIWVAKSPDHGVVIGASIVSAATATEVGATGVKRQRTRQVLPRVSRPGFPNRPSWTGCP